MSDPSVKDERVCKPQTTIKTTVEVEVPVDIGPVLEFIQNGGTYHQLLVLIRLAVILKPEDIKTFLSQWPGPNNAKVLAANLRNVAAALPGMADALEGK